MPTLDYHRPTSPETLPLAAQRILPIVATVMTFVFNAHWLDEPFGTFRLSDAAILVGFPIATVALWLVCAVLAVRRRAFPFAIVAILIWAFLSGFTAYESVTRYLFREPWTVP